MSKIKESEKPILSQRIRDRRRSKGVTQEKLAEEVGLTEITIRKYESGKHTVPPTSVVSIAKVLNCDAEYLRGESDDPHGVEHARIMEAARKDIAPIVATMNNEEAFEKYCVLVKVLGGRIKRFRSGKIQLCDESGVICWFDSQEEMTVFFDDFISKCKRGMRLNLLDLQATSAAQREETDSN